jgi:Flp pilus assembly protein TadD
VVRLFNYGSIYHLFADDRAKLTRSLERAVLEDKSDTESWSNLGCLLFNQGEHARASKCFDRALRLDRRDARLWHNAGVAAEKQAAIVAMLRTCVLM